MKPTQKLTWWMESTDREADNEGATRVRMVTSAAAITNNIYCEQPYCSADGNRLAMLRMTDYSSPADLLVYDIPSYRLAKLARQVSSVATAAWSGILFVTAGEDDGKRCLRVDLNRLSVEELFPWGDIPGGGISTVSADSRYGLGSVHLPDGSFGIMRLDLRSGGHEIIHRGPYIANPHLQYRLHNASRILVQENRGCIVKDGVMIRACDERGVGLYSINAGGDDRRDFPVGPPVTPRTTGHECWIGDTDRALVTVFEPHQQDGRRGTVLEVSHDSPQPRIVFETGYVWNHISATRCGKFFVTDCYQLPGVPILLGSIATGRTRVLCHAQTTGGGAQYSHAHPYITSDNQHVVFNSDRTGLAQVYIARIPDGFLDGLEA